ncbi:Carbonic anhydrase [Fulvia fulva]|nr:Carbonic anhydrase [Fulvia fulva]WPV30581.1 Carbonic anhydrase [Fulvia fulva]
MSRKRSRSNGSTAEDEDLRRQGPAGIETETEQEVLRTAVAGTMDSGQEGNEANFFTHLLENNRSWASKTAIADPTFFPACAKGQAPPVLFLGCADSRVPETTILGCRPGEVFTHRNIANIISNTDVSLLSIVQFAVFHLKVKDILVCGHTSCGGVAASLGNAKMDVLDVWLQPLRMLREKYADEIEGMDTEKRKKFLAEKNVLAGAENLKRIPTVIDAVRERGLEIHGVIYDVAAGLFEEIECSEDDVVVKKRVAAFERK